MCIDILRSLKFFWNLKHIFSLQRATSHYAYPWFVCFIYLFHTLTLLISKIFSFHWCLHITHAGLTVYLPIRRTDVPHVDCLIFCLSILVSFFFDIFLTFHIIFAFTSVSLSSSSSSTVPEHVFIGPELSCSYSSYSCGFFSLSLCIIASSFI